MASDSARVDAWLWAVRVFTTRSAATAACRAGHVRVNGERAKAAQRIVPGDAVVVRGARARDLVVKVPLEKRVGAAVAAEAMLDLTPPPPPKEEAAAPIARDRGSGRPTKRDRRDLERLRGR